MNTYDPRFLTNSSKIDTSDIVWEEARRHGLTPDERFILTYFADIESQTIRYLRELLRLKIAFQPDIAAFLTTWSYEEFFHGEALSRLLAECGYPLGKNRVEEVARQPKLNERIEAIFGPIFSMVFANQLPAIYTTFGAIQEMTTLRGYESLQRMTSNPVLAILCKRIAKQERRHFAWYFNKAREHLTDSRKSQFMTRRILKFNWVPVGAGVKEKHEVVRVFDTLFPDDQGVETMNEIDAKMGSLPGLADIELMRAFFAPGGQYR